MKKIKRLKYKYTPRGDLRLPSAGVGRRSAEASTETLEGQVQGLPASAGEERAARSLTKNERVEEFYFRLPVGGARNTPGWKELDLLVKAKSGLYYMIEVDSVFTHRQKSNADILHDAILLKELEYLGVYPKVFHVDGERDLVDQSTADEAMRRIVS